MEGKYEDLDMADLKAVYRSKSQSLKECKLMPFGTEDMFDYETERLRSAIADISTLIDCMQKFRPVDKR